MKKTLIFLFFAALVTGCTNDAENSTSKEDSVLIINAETEPATEVAPQPFADLFSFLQTSDSGFSTAYFQDFSSSSALDTLAALPIEKKHLAQYASYLIYNPDSSMAIDPYSNSYLIVKKDGYNKLTSGSPDTEVAIVDFKKGKRQRILYFGPSYMVIDAKWKSDKTVLFAISEVISNDKISPEIWEVDLNTFTKKVSRYPDTLNINVNRYREQKLNFKKA